MVRRCLKTLYLATSFILPFGGVIRETRKTQVPIRWRHILYQKILGFNRSAYWPVHYTSIVGNVKNIYAGIETSPGYMPGCYIQSVGKIYIGDYTQIAANVGIITANHDIYCNKNHFSPKEVHIGKYCWIGMNSVILPGVTLGDFTIVGAGSVVTKSFSEGYCVIGGNPAQKIRDLEKEKCVLFKSSYEYNGYIRSSHFEFYRKKYLNV